MTADQKLANRLIRDARWYRIRIPAAVANGTVLPFVVPRSTTRLNIFLTPGYQIRSGGVLSIAALYRQSQQLVDLHRSRVVLCTVPGEPPLLKYTWFKNRNLMFMLRAVLQRCDAIESVMLHVPEYAVNSLARWLAHAGTVHINVMLQNLEMIADQHVAGLCHFGKVTCTTAHEAYCNPDVRGRLGVPLHQLSTYIGPEMYKRVPYSRKKSLLVVSPDPHPLRTAVLSRISEAFPGLTIKTVQGMSHEKYKALLRDAKWMITFGEGLDGYFVEAVFSGSVAFTAFNANYFTPEFAALSTIYPSWDILLRSIADDMKRLDDAAAHDRCWHETYELVANVYQVRHFQNNLRLFYRGEYTFP